MSGPPKFEGVIFDMDGVLCDSEAFIAEAACRMFSENYKVHVVPADFLPFVGTGEDRFLGGVASKYGVERNLFVDKKRTYELYLEAIQGRLQPLPGAIDFIFKCQKEGLKIAVATSADRIKMDGNLRQIGISAETFDICVTGSEITHKKPHPEVFLVAAQKLGLRPEQCLVIEDAVHGVEAGVAAGSNCFGLTTSYDAGTLIGAGASWTAANLEQTPLEVSRRLWN